MRNMEKTKNKYEDIINLPHHVSTTRPQMSLEERAAQFSPFAALTGFENEIERTTIDTLEERESGGISRVLFEEDI